MNINAIKNEFDNLNEIIHNNLDILVFETKIDEKIPSTLESGSLLVYIRSYLLSRKLMSFIAPSDIQAIPYTINWRK